ncbi:MAG: class B sortase [Clostridia bacterium]|nr:class B sortase [Clostridia bacterium]
MDRRDRPDEMRPGGRVNRRKQERRRKRIRYLLMAFAAAVFVFGFWQLAGYGLDLMSSRRTSQHLKEVYYETETDVPPDETMEERRAQNAVPVMETPCVTPTPPPAVTLTPAGSSAVSPVPTPSPVPRLSAAGYPDNPKLQISSRFRTLRKESKSIVGWLSMGRILDEAVMQRDNVFYLNHDAAGKENVNGALFLEASISLKQRPYTYIIYGHNMKSGAMFGSLRNYENRSFYHNDPFITFDTIYENGRYVVFAVSTVSTESGRRNSVDFYEVASMNIEGRRQAIEDLISTSVYRCPVDVQPDDQLLILVTCVEKDADRRVVAARRVRDGEDEQELKQSIARGT